MPTINNYDFSNLAIKKLFFDSYDKNEKKELTPDEMYNARNKGIKVLLSAVEMELYSVLIMKEVDFLVPNDLNDTNDRFSETKTIGIKIYDEHQKVILGKLSLTDFIQRIAISFAMDLEKIGKQFIIADLYIAIDFNKGQLSEYLIEIKYRVKEN